MGEDLCQCQLRSVCFENKTLGTEMRLALSVVLLVCAAADRGSRYTECKDCVASSSEMYGCDIYTGNCDSFMLENESECWHDGFCYASDTADCCKVKTGAAVMLITIPLLILLVASAAAASAVQAVQSPNTDKRKNGRRLRTVS